MTNQPARIAFALSGGGSRGACHVGMLRALVEHGVTASLLTGTSAGAVTACWFGLYPGRTDTLESIWLQLRRADVFPGSALRVLTNFVRFGYAHAADRFEKFLRGHFHDARFEDLQVPVTVTAVDLRDGRIVVLDTGEIVPALMASTAIPGVFPPFTYRDRVLVDGGVLEHMPRTPLVRAAFDVVYALDCSEIGPQISTGLGVIDRCSQIAARANGDATIAMVQRMGREVHLLRPELPQIEDGRSFEQTAHLIDIGYTYADVYLETIAQGSGLAGA